MVPKNRANNSTFDLCIRGYESEMRQWQGALLSHLYTTNTFPGVVRSDDLRSETAIPFLFPGSLDTIGPVKARPGALPWLQSGTPTPCYCQGRRDALPALSLVPSCSPVSRLHCRYYNSYYTITLTSIVTWISTVTSTSSELTGSTTISPVTLISTVLVLQLVLYGYFN